MYGLNWERSTEPPATSSILLQSIQKKALDPFDPRADGMQQVTQTSRQHILLEDRDRHSSRSPLDHFIFSIWTGARSKLFLEEFLSRHCAIHLVLHRSSFTKTMKGVKLGRILSSSDLTRQLKLNVLLRVAKQN